MTQQISDKYRLLSAKPIASLLSKLQILQEIYPKKAHNFVYEKGIKIHTPNLKIPLPKRHSSTPQNTAQNTPNTTISEFIESLALDLRSWRKGPFFLGDLHIDSEWLSFKKWDLLLPYITKNNLLENAIVGDIGCNNGFYLFAMSLHNPKVLVGFDPNALFFCQFCFINHFLDLPICYELLGVQDLGEYLQCDNALKSSLPAKSSNKSMTKIAKFDVLFCLGVLYHRSDVFATLKSLSNALDSGGVAFVDTLIIEVEDILQLSGIDKSTMRKLNKNGQLSNIEFVLCPKKSYAKMRNVFFIPSMSAFLGWCERCGFVDVEVLGIVPTTTEEQRKTKWITSLSLESFLDRDDSTRTDEGYPAPKRAYFKLKRK